jgi:hypothetical protein
MFRQEMPDKGRFINRFSVKEDANAASASHLRQRKETVWNFPVSFLYISSAHTTSYWLQSGIAILFYCSDWLIFPSK